MAVIKRISRIISANINSLIEKAEEPEALLKQLIREMDESIINLRTEVGKAVAAEKRIGRRLEDTQGKVQLWQENSEKAVRDEDDDLARKAIARRLQEQARLPELGNQHKKALEVSNALKEQLRVLEDKIQEARRKKELLVARKRAAQAQQAIYSATQNVATMVRKSDQLLAEAELFPGPTMDSFEEEVVRLETEAEAIREVSLQEPSLQDVFETKKSEEAVEDELQALKEKLSK